MIIGYWIKLAKINEQNSLTIQYTVHNIMHRNNTVNAHHLFQFDDEDTDDFYFTLAFLPKGTKHVKHELDNLYFIIEYVAQIEYGLK